MLNADRTYSYMIDGKEVNKNTLNERQKFLSENIGYVLQTKNLVEYSVYRNVEYAYMMIGKKINRKKILRVLKSFDLNDEIDQSVEQLSEGQKQRLAILCAIIKKPRILILDEPTSALDDENTAVIMAILKQLSEAGMTIVLTSHQLATIKYADCVYMIENKAIILKRKCEDCVTTFKSAPKKIGIKSYVYYNRSFFQRYRWRNISIVLLYSIVFSLMLFAINYHDTISSNALKATYGSYNPNQIYIESNDSSIMQKMKEDQRIQAVYPYYELETKIGYDHTFDLLPIYPENQFESQYDVNNLTIEKNGNFASEEAYLIIQNLALDNLIINFQKNNDLVQERIQINGKFMPGMKNIYHDNPYFIYMPEQKIIELMNQLELPMEIKGYTIFIKDYTQKDRILDSYSITQFEELEVQNITIEQMKKTFENYQENMIVVVALFVFAVLMVMLYVYLNKRKVEIAIMMINGIDKENVFGILLIENICQLLISSIVGFSLFVVAYYTCIRLKMAIVPFNFTSSATLLFVLGLFTFTGIQLLNFVFLSILNKEKILRD